MATTDVTPALQRTRASAPAGVVIIPTLELSHPAWPAPYYLTSVPQSFTTTLETGEEVTFETFPFSLTLPSVDGAGQQDMQIVISNADTRIADAIRAAHAQPEHNIAAVYREFLSTAYDAPQSAPIRLSIDTLQVTEDAVAGVAGRSDVLNRRFPGIWYDVQHFPGLDR